MKSTAKRTRKRRALVRGEPVVRGVLTAALQQLARVGYGPLRIEDVAEQAGVNKTTVYRRWPTKEDLVRAALLSMVGDSIKAPNTGSLRNDLLEIARCMAKVGCSLEGQSLIRVMIAEGPDSELMGIARSIRETHEAIPRSVFENAVVRGELPTATGMMLVLDVLKATLNHRLFVDRASVDEPYLHRFVDLLLHGALHRKMPARKKTGS
jgi:AcrR family transcriptional regulator